MKKAEVLSRGGLGVHSEIFILTNQGPLKRELVGQAFWLPCRDW